MSAPNTSIKVVYRAYDKLNTEIFPISYTVAELNNYLRCICPTYVIVSLNPTTKEVTHK